MKKNLLLAFCIVLFAGSCSRHEIIPDKELAQIFHDAFLTNAYLGAKQISSDSLRLYEPIFARYGYTTEDVYNTIGNFSKRKSARLGDVVERAIDMLEEEGKRYDREVAILDTIDNVAQRTFTRTVLSDSVIRVKTLRDTSLLNFSLDVEPGEYRLSLEYRIDSLDRNTREIRGAMWLDRSNGARDNIYSVPLRRNRTERLTRRFTADTMHRHLRISLLNFSGQPQRPSVTVSDLKVEYIPPKETAVERLYEQQLNIRIFADEFFGAALAKDSLQ